MPWPWRRFLAATIAVFPLAGATAAEGPAAASAPAFKSCSLAGSGGNGNLHAECATWRQPLDRNDPGGEAIELFIARLPSTALEPAADALTIINGGPGGSSIDLLVDFAGVWRMFTRERDVVVIDQRGTGRSAPMTCDAVTDTANEPTSDETLTITRDCLNALPHDPRFFTTSAAVEDLESLRATLGYNQWSLYGVSYGTRVAQHFARRYPASTRTLVIDGVVPTDQRLGRDIAVHSQNAFDAVAARCAASAGCAEAFPTLGDDFARLATTLRDTPPAPLTLAHPITGEPTEIELSYAHLAIWLRFSLYAPETTALVPLIVSQAAHQQRYLPIAANAVRLVHDFSTALNYGMHNAVVCTEDAPFYDDTVDYAAMDRAYLGRDLYDTMQIMCSIWPEGVRHEDIKAPFTSSVPTLVLSGEFDPITPPAWGERAMAGLSRAVHVVAPGQGHGVIARGCIPRLALEFVEAADPEVVDSECTQYLSPSPFFVNLMGPPP